MKKEECFELLQLLSQYIVENYEFEDVYEGKVTVDEIIECLFLDYMN